jgi:hypothetical protein
MRSRVNSLLYKNGRFAKTTKTTQTRDALSRLLTVRVYHTWSLKWESAEIWEYVLSIISLPLFSPLYTIQPS